MVGETAREVAKVGDRLENLHGALQKVCMTACSGPDEFWQRNQLKPAGLQGSMLYKVRKFCNSKHLDSASVFDVSVFSLWCPAQETKLWRGQRSSFSACPSSFLLSPLSVSLFSVIVTMNWSWRVDVSLWLNMIRMPAACWTIFLNAAVTQDKRINQGLHWLQVEIVGQLSGQMGDMVGGVVETVGEEPEPESEDIAEQHEDEEEELTKVCCLYKVFFLLEQPWHPKRLLTP